MRMIIVVVFIVSTMFGASVAQQTEKEKQSSQQATRLKVKEPPRVYYGGELGLSFGDFFQISITPMIGYKITPKFHAGAKISYAYIEDKSNKEKITSHNYGFSVFTRYLIVRGLYAHAEFVYYSYKFKISDIEPERQWVPFVLLGAGYIQPIGGNASVYIEALWDVLQDSNSPYSSAEPIVKVGVGVGL